MLMHVCDRCGHETKIGPGKVQPTTDLCKQCEDNWRAIAGQLQQQTDDIYHAYRKGEAQPDTPTFFEPR